MKYYIKIMLCAGLLGILSFIFESYEESTELSSIIVSLGFGNTILLMSYAGIFMEWYFAYILFHVFFGTYIYRHFCCASTYYFSRCCNRTKWFVKECLSLYIFSLLYLVIMMAASVFSVYIKSDLVFDNKAIILIMYYLLINSLFLFFITLCINLISILISNSNGFIYVEGVLLFFIATFFIVGDNHFHSSPAEYSYKGIIISNPISHIIFNLHSSSVVSVNNAINEMGLDFDLNISVFYFMALSACAIIAGVYIVNRQNFINANQENGG